MLSFGWPEMLIVAAAALIIVGPRDLPMLLRNIGRVLGKVRRLGNDFKSEINKVAAIDDIKDIKKSITEPIASTQADIEKEFNKINTDGSVEPSGIIKPKDPNAKNIYDDIKQASQKPTSTNANAAKAKQQAEEDDEGQVASEMPPINKNPTAKKAKETEVVKPKRKKKSTSLKKAPAKNKTRVKKSKTAPKNSNEKPQSRNVS